MATFFPPEMLLECDKHYKFTTQRQSVQFVTDLIFHKDQTNGPRLTAPRFSLPTNTEIASPPADPIVKIDVPLSFFAEAMQALEVNGSHSKSVRG